MEMLMKTCNTCKQAKIELDFSKSKLKTHLESQFKPGMTWDNHGRSGWHIDHIKPLSAFNLADREEFLIAVNFSNLQPLWAIENLKKHKKVA